MLGELARPERDVVAACVERVAIAGDAPGVPGLEVGEVRTARLRAAAFDEKGGDQAPKRVFVELGHAELAARQRSTAADGSAGAGGGWKAPTSAISVTAATLDGLGDGT